VKIHDVKHRPLSFRYRIVRHLRGLRRLRGWRRIANRLASSGTSGSFIVENNGLVFQGDVSSFLEREIYLFGEYEGDLVKLFLSCIPPLRRINILDVGANIGTHSLAFSREFKAVHSFEPNPAVWTSFEKNMSLNAATNVTLHKIGLGASDAFQRFYSIAKANLGLGTFSPVEQYDLPLEPMGRYEVAKGDTYLASLNIRHVDAAKIDVQGFEPNVIRGLQCVLSESRPIVWFECGEGTQSEIRTAQNVRDLFPYPIELLRMVRSSNLLFNLGAYLDLVPDGYLLAGDYVAKPVCWPLP